MFFKKFKNLLQFKPYFKKYTKLIIKLLFVMLTASAIGVIMSFLMSKQLIGITDENTKMAIQFTIIILIAVTIHHINWYLWGRFHYKLSKQIACDIKADIMSSILDTKYLSIKNNGIGYYLERINSDVEEISTFLGNVAGVFVDVFTNLSFLLIIYFLSWQLGLFFTMGIVLLFIIESIKMNNDLKNLNKVKSATEQSNSLITEIIHGIKDIKGFGIKNAILQKNYNINTKLHNEIYNKNNQFELFSRLGTYLQWIIDSCLVFLSVLWLLPTGQITVMILLIIFNYKSLMYDTVGFFSKLKGYYINGDYYAERILRIIKDCPKEQFGISNAIITNGEICIKNLNYAYKNNLVLKDVDMEVKSHSLNLLIGNSGSGKSTLFMLLAKLYDVDNNTIFYDNHDINDFTEENLRNNVCIVNQEPFIFNDTIKNNIRVAKPNARDEEIFAVCKSVNLYNEIMNMDKQFDTILTENGTNISGGQRQRIELARAYLKDAKIILLDEPTSALDINNQQILLQYLQTIKKDKTIFMIAHKLSNYDYFDNIYEIHNGLLSKIK